MTDYLRSRLEASNSLFLEGSANMGKTTAAARYLKEILLQGNPSTQSVLVLVPQLHLAGPYRDAISGLDLHTPPTITTHSAFARSMLKQFWPTIAKSHPEMPDREPVFLNFEMAQYFMSRFATPQIQVGLFDGLSLPNHRLISQILDNMNKAALAGLAVEEAEQRLVDAGGLSLGSSREAVYRASSQIASNYRSFCLRHGLLDFAAQIELFCHHLLDDGSFEAHFTQTYTHFIADNIEEMGALAHDFIKWCLPRVTKSLVVFDCDAGYRQFLGADPVNAHTLADLCDDHLTLENQPLTLSSAMCGLVAATEQLLDDDAEVNSPSDALAAVRVPGDCLHILHTAFYPEMLRQCGLAIRDLVANNHAALSQIVVITPYVGDALRFALTNILADQGIAYHVLRPSRPVIAEPAIRVLMPLIAIAYAGLLPPPTPEALTTSLATLIDGLDPVRAHLLVQIVYRDGLSSWAQLNNATRERITEVAGDRYERLREWLDKITDDAPPVDHFLSRIYSDVLSQPGYGFHDDLNAHRAVGTLIQSAQRFRETVYLADVQSQSDSNRELLELLTNGLIAAQYEAPIEMQEAVLITPAHTYLIQNKVVDYQFWLDIGHSGWSERLEQPLTHPYVLRRSYTTGHVWTDEDEQRSEDEALKHVTLGLLRRCRKGVFAGYCDLNEMGYEQYGPMARLFNKLLLRTEINQ